SWLMSKSQIYKGDLEMHYYLSPRQGPTSPQFEMHYATFGYKLKASLQRLPVPQTGSCVPSFAQQRRKVASLWLLQGGFIQHVHGTLPGRQVLRRLKIGGR